ncbi:MAG: hypothetical protein KN64_03275 [Sulfurovum sp. AS07-7]|nr:MAG: hypothetical protein KN64_03275 [Sulfurovum sp. AS07-7]
MKMTKLSLVVALAVTSSFGAESTISGDAKLFYSTFDGGNQKLFDKGANSMGDVAVSLDYSKEVASGVTLNAGVTGVSTLGLEDTLVGATWINHGLEDRAWLDVANVTATLGKTTAVIGRQKLDTPLAFTETWNVAENTFDAFTFVNGDIADTTLVGSAVTRANGGEFKMMNAGMTDLGEAIYAVGAISKSIPNTTAQAWYYDFASGDKKAWLQADVDAGNGVSIGGQYASLMANTGDDGSIVAGKVAYTQDGMGVYGAYSQADDKGQAGSQFANYAGFGGSKLYTEAWWNYGFVTQKDAKTFAVGANYTLGDIATTLQYTGVKNDLDALSEMDEVTFTATKKIGAVNTTLAFINTSSDNTAVDGKTVQAYLTLPFSF